LKGASSKKIWAERYNGLGGHIEPGEDVQTAAQRELLEEAGLDCRLALCGTVFCDVSSNPGVALFVFRGFLKTPAELRVSNEGELVWVQLEEVKNLPAVDDLVVLVNRAYHWRADQTVFSALNRYDIDGKLVTTFYD
jgi:8-oxo-dGTP diphosphatase